MEHHIYLTFLTAFKSKFPYDEDKLRNTLVSTTIKKPYNEIIQTSESVLKTVLHDKRNQFTLEKLFFFETKELSTKIKRVDNPSQHITTKQIFESRITDFINEYNINLDWSSNTVEYIECGDIENISNLKASILNMSQQMMKFYHAQPKEDTVTLHVDLTGGPRTAIMLMLAIIRLVAYQGMQIGSISYANLDNESNTITVYESKDIYFLFDMIAGFSEFTHYGDAKTLRHYFDQTNTEDELTNQLLAKMDDFSEAISLSSRGLFQSSVEGINTLFTNIASRKQDNSQFELGIFQLMRNKIQESYETIVSDPEDDLVYIEWCLQNDYLQQALALFVEYVPRTILKEKIIALDKNKFETKKDDNRSPEMLHFNQINDKIGAFLVSLQTSYMNKAIKATKKVFHTYWDELATESIRISQLTTSENGLISKEATNLPLLETNVYQQVKGIMKLYNISQKDNPSQYSIKQFIKFLSDITLNGSNIGNLNAFPKEIRQVCISLITKEHSAIKNLLHVDDDYCISINRGAKYFLIRKELFNGFKSNCKDDGYKVIFNFTSNDTNLYRYNYQNDFPNNVFNIKGLSLNQCLSEPLVNDTIDLLTSYNTLKQVRNDTAHANEEKKGRYTSSQDIRREIERCLGIIRELAVHIRACEIQN